MANTQQYMQLADEYLPAGWDDAPSRREQILAVISNFLDTPEEMATRDRRLRAQEQAAQEFGVTVNTIQSKCGRETWENHVPSSDDYQRQHFQTALENIEAAIQSGDTPRTDGSAPQAVWIEKTEIEGRTYKKEGKLELGNAIYSPSQDKQGHDRYAQMREASPGDLVLHLLQDKECIVGVSTIASELETDFEGLPEFGWTDEQAGYRRWLSNYHEFEQPVHVYDDILDNQIYEQQLDEIRDGYSNLFYDKNHSLVQGGYFTQCPPELLAILTDASTELTTTLEAEGYPIDTLPTIGMDPAGEYDSIDGALSDIRDRLQQTQQGTDWVRRRFGNAIITDWSAALAGFKPSEEVSSATAAKFDQLRSVYGSLEPEFETKAEELGVGTFEGFSSAEMLFLGSFRHLQEEADVETGLLRQPRLNSILTDSYTVAGGNIDQPPISEIDHPLAEQLVATELPVRKITAPPDYWLTALQYGSVSFEEDHHSIWEDIEPGEIALLHSRSQTSDDALPEQPNGIIESGLSERNQRKRSSGGAMKLRRTHMTISSPLTDSS